MFFFTIFMLNPIIVEYECFESNIVESKVVESEGGNEQIKNIFCMASPLYDMYGSFHNRQFLIEHPFTGF